MGPAMLRSSAAPPVSASGANRVRYPRGVGSVSLRRPRRCVTAQGTASAGGLVVLTREAGKNGPLSKRLEKAGLSVMEMPLIESVAGPDRERLPTILQEEQFDWVALTSPEAASVFLESWRLAGEPAVRIAVVGEGTGLVLEGTGLEASFVPSKAHAVAFSAEFPGDGTVLYPASAKASTVLQDGLAARGFKVKRIHTYDTVAVSTIAEEQLMSASCADVITIGSPSAVKAWVTLAGRERAEAVPVACIGETSANAARALGLPQVYCPEAPGLEGWMESIHEAIESKDKAMAERA